MKSGYNLQLSGEYGGVILDSASFTSCTGKFRGFTVLQDSTVISAFDSPNVTGATSFPSLNAGFFIEGVYTSFTLSSGMIMAWHHDHNGVNIVQLF